MMTLAYAAADIPLVIGMDQTGYIARFGGATGILDRPRMKVLLLREEFCRPTVLVFCDLLGFSPERTHLYEKRIARLAGTTREEVVITCTHSHAAPASMSLLLLGECRDSWFSLFEKALEHCVFAALKSGYSPVKIAFGKTAVEGVARNRVKLDQTSVDTDETVLCFTTAEKRIALVNYACHPVTLNADNRLFSSDYPAVVCRELIAEGAADEVIFATSPCGDLNPIEQDKPGEYERMEEYGKRIAEGAAALLKSGSLMELSGFSCEKLFVKLPLCAEHPRADHAACARRYREKYLSERDPVTKKYDEANVLYAQSMQTLSRYGLSETEFFVTLTRLRFGGFTVLGVPFELFSGIGIHLKESFAPACVFELCGGNFGYFPSDELWEQAEYERGDAYMYYNRGGPLPQGSEARLTEAFRR